MALSEKAKEIGDRFAFPVPATVVCEISYRAADPGMTYRQWLIGQRISAGIIGDFMIEQVDQILETLATEESK